MDGPGRPTLYEQGHAEQAHKLCLGGATNDELAECFDVSRSTIDKCLKAQPEFAEAVRCGRKIADGEVAHKLYSRAMDYTYEATKVLMSRGEPLSVPQTVHCPPSEPASSGCAIASRSSGTTQELPRTTRTIGRSSSETFGKQASVPRRCGPLDDRLSSRPSRPPRRSPAPAVSPTHGRATTCRSNLAALPASNAAAPAGAHEH